MYIIQEIQTNGTAIALVPAKTFTDRKEAESAYYLALSAAAVSEVEVHTMVMYDEHGNMLLNNFYEHFTK